MSISNSDSIPNPSQKWIKFKKGKFVYWDKEKEAEIEIPRPFTFVVLDQLATITGWHDPSESGIVSNEVHSTQFEELTVRTYKGESLAKGLYGEIKDNIKASGGRYTTSIYALLNDELVNFKFAGASLSEWISNKPKSHFIKIEKVKSEKKGDVEYFVPILGAGEETEEMLACAKAVDAEVLQPYLDQYKKGITNSNLSNQPETKKPESQVGFDDDEVKTEDLLF